ncbi:hypothetical protein E4U61_005733 [Claviceps capensis]|nr:hypothetical protein E4U61_005733 [Claviceps capensis]
MIDPTAITEAPIVERPLAETQSLEEKTVDTPAVETPLTAPTMETLTALTEEATPDAQPMDTAHDTEADHVHEPQNSPGHHVGHEQETQQEDNTSPVTVSEQPRYFTRATRKRAMSDITEEENTAKRVRAMIAHLLPNDTEVKTYLELDHESAFPAEVIAGI